MRLIEQLERRSLLSASSSASLAFKGGTLEIVGSAASEAVTFNVNASAKPDAAGKLRAVNMLTVSIVDTAKAKVTRTMTIALDQLKAVKAKLGDGADQLKGQAFNVVQIVNNKSVTVTKNVSFNVDAGNGNDTVVGGESNDTLNGGAGTDSLEGSAGDDVLKGGNDDDTLAGGTGNDSCFGEAGNDLLADSTAGTTFQKIKDKAAKYAEKTGQDLLDGGSGNDAVSTYGRIDRMLGIERAKDFATMNVFSTVGQIAKLGKVPTLSADASVSVSASVSIKK